MPDQNLPPSGDIARAYDRWAAQYDADRNATRDLDAEIVRRAPLRLPQSEILELGCGTGKNTVWLATQARHLLAMDFSAGMLEAARRNIAADNVRFIQHDVCEPWPIGNGSVDAIVSNLILEHVEHVEPIFTEAARVLRSGGQIFVSELHPFRQLRGGQAHFTTSAGETIHVPAFTHSTSEFVNAGLAAGFFLRELGEWLEADAAAGAPPRLLTLLFERG